MNSFEVINIAASKRIYKIFQKEAFSVLLGISNKYDVMNENAYLSNRSIFDGCMQFDANISYTQFPYP